ncbi:MAG: nickel-dependent lactate racemase [Deltaproteobacteria bacterium]|nr:nickel-dependent lactate racemase [Deltaproteobacteria bacterium]
MSDKSIVFPWGQGSVALTLPESWRVLGTLSPREMIADGSVEDSCNAALFAPIAAQRLAERQLKGKRIVLVSDDHTRPTPVSRFIACVLNELGKAGVEDAQIEILIATGVHRASREDEVEAKLGRPIMGRFAWRCHDAYDASQLTYLGNTSRGTYVELNKALVAADLVICLGAIEPHLLMGFGGGLKMIVPGCASNATIGTNHMQGVDPQHFDLVGVDTERSPMRLDLEEAAGLLGDKLFIVNAVMNEHGDPVRFFAGDPRAAHRAGVAFIRQSVGIELPERADVVLTNSSPLDADFRQSCKCLGNAMYAAKEGGMLLGCARAANGLGEFPVPPKSLPYVWLRRLLWLVGQQRILPLVRRLKKNEPVEEVFIGHFGLQMLRRNHIGIFSDNLPADLGKKIGIAQTFTEPQAMIAWAKKVAPKRATVWVLPHGGATFAFCEGDLTGVRVASAA